MAGAVPLAFACGILGNVISIMVYLAPVPTFYQIICKKKSTEGFQAVPYVMALFSAMLIVYYALIKTNSFLLIAIHGFGLFIETVYIVLFLVFAHNKACRISALKLLLSLNVVTYSVIVGLTLLLLKGNMRVKVVRMINVLFSPLSITRLVIQTRSVEFMPFPLSFTLTVSAIMWFFYGLLIGLLIDDRFVATPNILRFVFGVAQMVLYAIYRNANPPCDAAGAVGHNQPELVMIEISTTAGSEVHPIETELQVGDEEGDAELQIPHGGMSTDGSGDGRCLAAPYEIQLTPPLVPQHA